MNCFEESEPIVINRSIIGDGPSARVPYAAAKTAKLTLQRVGPGISQPHSGQQVVKARPYNTRAQSSKDKTMPPTTERTMSYPERDLKSIDVDSDNFDPGKPAERLRVEGKYRNNI